MKLTIDTAFGPRIVRCGVSAGGLGIHRSLERGRSGWVVCHLASGLKLHVGCLSFRHASALMRGVLCLGIWEQTHEEIASGLDSDLLAMRMISATEAARSGQSAKQIERMMGSTK